MMMDHLMSANSRTTVTKTNYSCITKQAAPVRCFLNDIPTIIARHYHQSYRSRNGTAAVEATTSNTADTTMMESSYDNDSAFHNNNIINCDTDDHAADRKRRKIEMIPSTLWLRLLGTVVNISIATTDIATDENMDITTTTSSTTTSTTNSGTGNCEPPQQLQPRHEYTNTIAMDDGTGATVLIHVTLAMIEKISISTGMILDCIVRVELPPPPPPPPPSHNYLYPTTGTATTPSTSTVEKPRFIADQIAVQDSTMETLRWFELSYQATSSTVRNQPLCRAETGSSSGNGTGSGVTNHPADTDSMCDDDDDDDDRVASFSPPDTALPNAIPPGHHQYTTPQSKQWMGYPTRDLSSEDIYRIIASECEFASLHHSENNNNHHRTKSSASSSAAAAASSSSSNGVSLQDLADCFDYSIAYIGTLVQELQNSGQIYQNENGLYTLL